MKTIYIFFYILLLTTKVYSQVSINTQSPSEMLDVNGEVRVRVIDTITNIPKYVLTTDEDGVIKKTPTVLLKKDNNSSDASRLIGGIVSVLLSSTTNGTLNNSELINNGGSYQMGGNISYTSSSKGGIVLLEGAGYKISNPANGIFDIKFDVPFTEIYGISSNVIDNYVSSKVSTTTPGSTLNPRENTLISYIDNEGFRLRTGNASGNLSNRTFTFLVTGR